MKDLAWFAPLLWLLATLALATVLGLTRKFPFYITALPILVYTSIALYRISTHRIRKQ